MSDWLTRLLGALREAQVDLTAEDVADAVWLMPRLGRVAERAGGATRGPGPASAPEAPQPVQPPRPAALPEGAPAPVPSGETPAAPGQYGELYLPSGDKAGPGWGRPFRSPAGSPLPGALAVARALRPLRQRLPSPHRLAFDEAETVRRVAEEGIWLPALRPARDRWLDLSLVVDAGASMGLWLSTAEELRRLLEWTGAFRNVRVWHLDTNATSPCLRAGLRYRAGMPSRNPLELVDPSGRSLVLLLSDCVSPGWYGGMAPLLETWGRRGPLVLLQVLPEHLWSRTALGTASPVRLAAPAPASPNARLSVRPVDAWPGARELQATPVPTATLEPGATAGWARLVAGIREVWVPGFVPDPEAASRPAPGPEEPISAEVRVARFWRVASPTARRLAGLLAASPALSLPLVRLIRQALLPGARQVHEAEVLLGGLLRVATGPAESRPDPEEVRYDFHDGVRPLLLDAVPTADALGVLEKVSSYDEEHLAQGQDFRAILADPTAARGAVVADASPFARVAAEVLQRLGGDYARLTRSRPASSSGRGPLEAAGGRTEAPPPARTTPTMRGKESSPHKPGVPEEGWKKSRPATGGKESYQHKLDRVRAPRVSITYEVELSGGVARRDLPFVIGVLADLSGNSRAPILPLKDRKFIIIDRDNFSEVMSQMAPGLALRLSNRLTDDGSQLAAELTFRHPQDFEPARVVAQVAPLRALLDTRQRLADLLTRLHRNEQLETLLAGVLHDSEKAVALGRQLGNEVGPSTGPPESGGREAAPVPAAPPSPGPSDLLDQVLTATQSRSAAEAERHRAGLGDFIAWAVAPGQVVAEDVEINIKRWIGQIDAKLSAQLNEVMHHPDFQRLEGTWRGLYYLVHQSETGESLKIRVLNASKFDLFKDAEEASEFDQSRLFRQVYECEFGTLGGEPYGLLVGDYEFNHGPEDVRLLTTISNVAAAAHAPFVAAAAPALFGLGRFTELSAPRDLAKSFSAREYVLWNSFRDSEDARYAALTLPRVLARLPYGESFRRAEEFNFDEFVDGPDHDKYLWMSAAWAYAARVADAFARFGWLARTRGVEGGGKVEGLPIHTFPTDDGDIALKCPTEVAIHDRREFELSSLGFLPLIHFKNTDFAAFLGAQSCQKPKRYDNPDANANAELAAKFNYTLCVSRFAHYFAVIARGKLGSFVEIAELERGLNEWVMTYVVSNPETAGEEMKARYPLADARVEVRPRAGAPGRYQVMANLRPHFQLGTLPASVRLVVEVPLAK